MNLLRITAAFSAIALAQTMGLAADSGSETATRFASINLDKVYAGFQAAQTGEKALQGRVAELKERLERKAKTRQALLDQYQAALTELAKAKETKDEAALKKASRLVDDLPQMVKDTEEELQTMGQNPELAKALQTHRETISAAIKIAILKVSKEKHYSAVLDTSAMTAVGVGVITILDNKVDDITGAVVDELNRMASPAALNSASPAPAAK